jgi:hypothetical protein
MVLAAAAGFILVSTGLIDHLLPPASVSSLQKPSVAAPGRAPAMNNTLDAAASVDDSVLILPPLEPVVWRGASDQLQASSLTVASALPQPFLDAPHLDEPVLHNTPAAVAMPLVEPVLRVAQASVGPGTDKPNPSLLVIYGNEYLSRSDVTAARLFYRRAADGGSANGAAALAASYDPLFLEQRAGLRGVRPDPEEALRWYRVAAKLGDPSANTRLTALIEWLQSAASRGDEKARALLDQTAR